MKRIAMSPRRLRWVEVAFWVALASCFFLLPDKLTLMSQILIFGLFAVSLDMALGYAGILTVGHAAFFGAGAYAAGLLAKHGWGEPFTGLLVALAVCTALGYLLSYLVVRGADLTRLMITIGVCVLLAELANRLSGITGGTDGLQGMVMWPVLGLFEFDLFGKTAFLYAFGVVLVLFLGVRLILRSPFGLALRGIHDSRKRMLAIGSPVESRLRMAYALSAAGITLIVIFPVMSYNQRSALHRDLFPLTATLIMSYRIMTLSSILIFMKSFFLFPYDNNEAAHLTWGPREHFWPSHEVPLGGHSKGLLVLCFNSLGALEACASYFFRLLVAVAPF